MEGIKCFLFSTSSGPTHPRCTVNNGRTNALYKRNRSCSLMLSSQPHTPHGTESGDRKHFSARQVLNVSEQGSKFLGRPPFFSKTVNFTADDCTLRFVDVDVQEPIV